MIWVTAEDVVAIHSRIIQVSGGIDGLRTFNRPRQLEVNTGRQRARVRTEARHHTTLLLGYQHGARQHNESDRNGDGQPAHPAFIDAAKITGTVTAVAAVADPQGRQQSVQRATRLVAATTG